MIKRVQSIKSGFSFILLACISNIVQAQKLNSIQQNSVWAPANIKIDGKLNEWDDTFQAYNKTTDIFYTVSNDNKDLYFVIKSIVPIINNKIIAGGINFTINTADKKRDNDKNTYVVGFPMIDMAAMRSQMQRRAGAGGSGGGMGGGPPRGGGGGGGFGSINSKPDSAGIAMRRQALKSVKDIRLLGFATDIPDSVISIYNEYGVKAAVDYDATGNLTCEIAVPLKYLHLSTDNPKEFSYNIKLNGLDLSAMMPPGAQAPGPPGGGFGGGGGGGGRGGGGRGGGGRGFGGGGLPPPGAPSLVDMQSMISPTDFWGKYTLAKKQ